MKKRYILIALITIFTLIIVNQTMSELKPVSKVSFSSKNLDYDNKELGAYKLDKSAKWTDVDKAVIRFDLNSRMKESSGSKDIIFVLDVSGSMSEDKRIEAMKKNVKELAAATLDNPNNQVALITFDSGARLLSSFTRDKKALFNKIDDLESEGATNYKAALDEAVKLLNNYEKKPDKDVILLFLTDGYPNEQTPNEVSVYRFLKHQYPFLKVHAVQYEMGNDFKAAIRNTSEKQFHADMKGLSNTLFKAGADPIAYDHFIVTDYISKHFISDDTKIKTNQGKAVLDGNKITWDLGEYKSGTNAWLEIEVTRTGDTENLYPTNDGTEIESSFEKQKDNQKSTKTPVLKGSYKVIYDGNIPGDCKIKNLPETKSYKPYEKIKINKEEPLCDNYMFNKYEILTDIKMLNDDYFEMPSSDVTLRATWTKAKIDKKMDGEVAPLGKLFNFITEKSLGTDKANNIDYSKINSLTNGEGLYMLDETKNDTFPVYFFRGSHKLNNNVIYANMCWKIVRTTETGGIRLIYNGTPVNGACSTITGNKTTIGNSIFNKQADKQLYSGYMYGDDTNPNQHDSVIKKYIDNWYVKNIKPKYAKALDTKAIYCSERVTGSEDSNFIDFISGDRMKKNTINLKCNLNDSYSVEAGNKKLTYPVALITADEVRLAGIVKWSSVNTNFYLYNEASYWTMTPASFAKSGSTSVWSIYYLDSHLLGSNVSGENYVRPSVTLKHDIDVYGGKGSTENPYII